MTRHLKVKRSNAQEVIDILKRNGYIDHSKKIMNSDEAILIPLLDSAPESPSWEIVDREPQSRISKNRPISTKTSFDQLGSAAILKIRNMDRAITVARSLIEGSNTIRSVFLDTGIQGDNRLRTLTLLAGEENYIVEHREHSLRFRFDLREVYFSPRLATERLLVSKLCQPGQKVLDMFAGIGPFAITIAKLAGSWVTAFDVNPQCIRWLKENVIANHVEKLVSPYLGDSRTLIEHTGKYHRIIMNLPHSSSGFLETASRHLLPEGRINYYEICNLDTLEERMEKIRNLGLELVYKRIVHGYAPGVFMHSLELKLKP
jgi:tRNA (guanine37-N1)-methyltransferase